MKSGATASIPLGMLVKRFYCHKCGERLKTVCVIRTLNPGDLGYRAAENAIFDTNTLPKGAVSVTAARLICPACHTAMTFGEQKEIAQLQKRAGTRIL
jgi:RNase P subunit RPR2